jgi:hypothetical protein
MLTNIQVWQSVLVQIIILPLQLTEPWLVNNIYFTKLSPLCTLQFHIQSYKFRNNTTYSKAPHFNHIPTHMKPKVTYKYKSHTILILPHLFIQQSVRHHVFMSDEILASSNSLKALAGSQDGLENSWGCQILVVNGRHKVPWNFNVEGARRRRNFHYWFL